MSETSSINGDIFKNNTNYLNEKAKNGIFLLKQSTKFLGNLPPVHMLYLYESMIEPILLYGSDLWGSSKTCTQNINKVFLWFVRIVLNIKSTTSNIITMGESGMIPPNIKCHINVIIYFVRLNSMKSGPVIKNVFNELHNFHNLGFKNWYSNVLELAKQYNIDPTSLEYNMSTKKSIKSIVCASFIESWKLELQNTEKNTSLDTYKIIKSNYMKEPYLTKIKKQKYLSSFSRFRAGSHALEIERGRYTNPRIPRALRLCVNCN